MRVRLLVLPVCVAAVLVAVPGATAKEFQPGDLRICNHHRCVAITNQSVLNLLGAFYYTGQESPAKAHAPRLGARAFELRFDNGYATGMVATRKLDRFLSFGVNLGRFARGQWYRLPYGAPRELRRLATALEPLRVTRRSLARSR
jgi:hypothetical protein